MKVGCDQELEVRLNQYAEYLVEEGVFLQPAEKFLHFLIFSEVNEMWRADDQNQYWNTLDHVNNQVESKWTHIVNSIVRGIPQVLESRRDVLWQALKVWIVLLEVIFKLTLFADAPLRKHIKHRDVDQQIVIEQNIGWDLELNKPDMNDNLQIPNHLRDIVCATVCKEEV